MRPGWSTEGQTRLRARRRAWPSVPIGLVPKIRVVRVDLSSQAQVQRTAARRGDRLITNSPCRCAMSPGRRSVQPDHRTTPKAAVPWGGSFCFPLMAPPVAPDIGQVTTLVASQQVCALFARYGLRCFVDHFFPPKRLLSRDCGDHSAWRGIARRSPTWRMLSCLPARGERERLAFELCSACVALLLFHLVPRTIL